MAKIKMKRYDDGGITEDMRFAAEEEGKKDDGPDRVPDSGYSEPKSSQPSFKSAFAAARRNGEKTFMYNGKSYTTELASNKKRTSPPTRPGQEPPIYSNEGRTSSESKGRVIKRSGSDIAKDMGVNSKTLLPNRMAKGGVVSTASSRADGIAQRGKTKGRMC